MGDKDSLEEIIHKPIELPKSPFFEVFKSFGRDEAIDLCISTTSTAIMSALIDSQTFGPMSSDTKDAALSITGPVVGKLGFFPAHVYDAIKHYHSHSSQDREPLSFYLKKAFKEGRKNLFENITFQDPVYIGMMWAGLRLWPETPPWMLSMVSTMLSVGALSITEVAVKEALYAHYKNKLKRAGFHQDSYFESRFYIHKDKHPEAVLEELSKEFTLGNESTETCHDKYFPTHLRIYNGRKPQLRLREMEVRNSNHSKDIKEVQIDYTKASELPEKEQEQFRYFLKKKDKFVYRLKQGMPSSPEDIDNLKVRRIVQKAKAGKEYRDIEFQRTFTYNKELLCATDKVLQEHKRPFYVIELKTRKNINVLKDGMHFVMSNFPVVETTHDKLDLIGVKNYCR
jgi:hypothetical protein